MGAARKQKRHQENERRSAHSKAVPLRIDPSVKSIQLDSQNIETRRNEAGAKRIWAELWFPEPFKNDGRQQREPKQGNSLSSRALRLGKLRPFGFHSLSSAAASTCPPPRPPARGAVLVTLASFAMVLWTITRGIAS